MPMPQVLNLRGRKGVMPEGAVYIGRRQRYEPWRHLPHSKWHNPFKLRRNASQEERAEVLARYERHLHDSGLVNDLHELRGRDLACWCKPAPCHGDVLLRLANE
jgi:hypothetical protein